MAAQSPPTHELQYAPVFRWIRSHTCWRHTRYHRSLCTLETLYELIGEREDFDTSSWYARCLNTADCLNSYAYRQVQIPVIRGRVDFFGRSEQTQVVGLLSELKRRINCDTCQYFHKHATDLMPGHPHIPENKVLCWLTTAGLDLVISIKVSLSGNVDRDSKGPRHYDNGPRERKHFCMKRTT